MGNISDGTNPAEEGARDVEGGAARQQSGDLDSLDPNVSTEKAAAPTAKEVDVDAAGDAGVSLNQSVTPAAAHRKVVNEALNTDYNSPRKGEGAGLAMKLRAEQAGTIPEGPIEDHRRVKHKAINTAYHELGGGDNVGLTGELKPMGNMRDFVAEMREYANDNDVLCQDDGVAGNRFGATYSQVKIGDVTVTAKQVEDASSGNALVGGRQGVEVSFSGFDETALERLQLAESDGFESVGGSDSGEYHTTKARSFGVGAGIVKELIQEGLHQQARELETVTA
ncbi:hypothetical protein OAO01_06170 [Oligoflexia bacterium]|nr:hypothetical protein [Oligoflexia bacterium]